MVRFAAWMLRAVAYIAFTGVVMLGRHTMPSLSWGMLTLALCALWCSITCGLVLVLLSFKIAGSTKKQARAAAEMLRAVREHAKGKTSEETNERG